MHFCGFSYLGVSDAVVQLCHNLHNLTHILRYLMVRLQPGVLDIETDDVRFAGKLLEEELLGIVTMAVCTRKQSLLP